MKISSPFFLLGILCFVFSLPLLAQQDFSSKTYFLIDSLNHFELSGDDSALVLSKMESYHQETEDTNKLAILVDLVEECWNDDVWPRYNSVVLSQATEALNKTDNQKLRNKYLHYQGVAYANQGYLHDIQSEFETAEKNYKKALEVFEKSQDEKGQGKMLYAIALINEERGRVQVAIDYFNKSLRLAEASGDSAGLTHLSMSLGDIHASLSNKKEAMNHYRRALQLAKGTGDKRLEGFASTTLATMYFYQEDYEQARELSLKGIQLLEEAKAGADKINGLDVLGRIAAKQGQLDSAEMYFTEIVKLAKTANRPQDVVQGLYSLAQNDMKQGNYAKAEKNAKEAYRITKELDLKYTLSDAAGLLAEIYTKTNKYKEANEYLLEFNSLKDTLRNENLKNQALKQSIEYEYEKQQAIADAEHEAQLAVAAARESRQNIIIWAVAAILVLISIALVLNFFRLRTIRKQKEALDEAYHQLELSKNDKILASNLKALQAQMNPHFIFNALNSIQTLVLHGDVDSSYDYINKFAMLIRETLNASEQEFIPIEKEIESLETYLKLEKLRFRDDFNYEINTPDRIPNKYIPPMLIQPFIENALKHGLFHKETDRKLDVKISISDTLTCVIEDNGIGREASRKINQSRNADHKSYAIGSIKKRLEMMQEKLKTTIGVNYEDLEENGQAVGTRVTIRIPIYDRSSNKTNAA